jgi:hypothetical protein
MLYTYNIEAAAAECSPLRLPRGSKADCKKALALFPKKVIFV